VISGSAHDNKSQVYEAQNLQDLSQNHSIYTPVTIRQMQHFFSLPQDIDSADVPHPLQATQATCCTLQWCQAAI